MMSLTVDINPFDPQSIENAIKAIKKYQNDVLKEVHKLIPYMLRLGEAYAINEMGHIDTGETLASIYSYREDNVGYIVAGGASVWIEFGTGVRNNGEGSPHPKGQELGFTIGGYGQGKGSDPNGWYYYKDGKVHHTYGIKANSFMWRTSEYMRQNAPAWAKERLGGK